MNMTINEKVGSNIRKYRLAHNYTLKELSTLAHKSCSTISKYEKGVIPINMDTIEEFSKIFHIAPSQLLSVPYENSSVPEKTDFLYQQYMYAYDGKRKRIMKSVIEEFSTSEENTNSVQIFYDVADLKDPGKCQVIYSGVSHKFGPWQNYHLKNLAYISEEIWMCALDNFSQNKNRVGILAGISSVTMSPSTRKILISSEILKDSVLLDTLILSKEDIQSMKKYNIFSISQLIDE